MRAFGDRGKPIGVKCHGPWLLISAGLAKGRRIAAWPSLKWDLENAGATYVDEPVVRDGPFVTARNPDGIPQLNLASVEHFRPPARAGSAEWRMGPQARKDRMTMDVEPLRARTGPIEPAVGRETQP